MTHTMPSLMSNSSTQLRSETRGKILLDATHQFSAKRKIEIATINQYKELFYSLIPDTDKRTAKIISATLARVLHTPRTIAFYLAMEPIEIAAPFLLISQSLQVADLMQLSKKLSLAHINVIARRSDITAELKEVLVEYGDNSTLIALNKNPIARLNLLLGKEKQTLETPAQSSQKAKLQLQIEVDKEKLLGLAGQNGKLGQKSHVNNRSKTARNLSEKLLTTARAGGVREIAQIIAETILLPAVNVEKMLRADEANQYCVVLKALNVKRSDALQIILLTDEKIGNNVAKFNQTAAFFDNLIAIDCQDILRKLNARNLPTLVTNPLTTKPTSMFENAAKLRSEHIHTHRTRRAGVVFGKIQNSA